AERAMNAGRSRDGCRGSTQPVPFQVARAFRVLRGRDFPRVRAWSACLYPVTSLFPRTSVSVTFALNSKFAPGRVLAPLHASSHSRSFPGDSGRDAAGGTNASIFDEGISLGLPPLKPHNNFPLSPTNKSPS